MNKGWSKQRLNSANNIVMNGCKDNKRVAKNDSPAHHPGMGETGSSAAPLNAGNDIRRQPIFGLLMRLSLTQLRSEALILL